MQSEHELLLLPLPRPHCPVKHILKLPTPKSEEGKREVGGEEDVGGRGVAGNTSASWESPLTTFTKQIHLKHEAPIHLSPAPTSPLNPNHPQPPSLPSNPNPHRTLTTNHPCTCPPNCKFALAHHPPQFFPHALPTCPHLLPAGSFFPFLAFPCLRSAENALRPLLFPTTNNAANRVNLLSSSTSRITRKQVGERKYIMDEEIWNTIKSIYTKNSVLLRVTHSCIFLLRDFFYLFRS